MTGLVFLSASARARVVASHSLFNLYRCARLCLAVGTEVLVTGLHIAEVLLVLYRTLRLLVLSLGEIEE